MQQRTPDEVLALIEGEAVPAWHLWWPDHEAELRDLPRTDYLKLKFEKVRAAGVTAPGR